jgi:hypothetical protein
MSLRAGPPSPDLIARFNKHRDSLALVREHAAPWKGALAKAFAVEKDSALREQAADFIFLTTYKHYVPARKPGKTATTTLARKAAAFHAAWKALADSCGKAKLPSLELTEAIYRLTNSDWAPVSVAAGPGLNNVKTAGDYTAWGLALIDLGKRAQAAGLDPIRVWRAQAAGYKIRESKDLASAELQPAPVMF